MSVGLLTPEAVAQAYKNACLTELQALKPGNVHVFADGHGMTVYDFIKSADASAAVIAQAGVSVGERIGHAVKATQAAVGMNTNLGLILLAAPLVHAALATNAHLGLTSAVTQVLNTLSDEDGWLAAQAILLANPAGLGRVASHDVHAPAKVNLGLMMASAADRDRIAWQYAHAFADIFNLGLPCYLAAKQRWQEQAKNDSDAWAASAVYLAFLAHYEDSHILRKFGVGVAAQVKREAQAIEAKYRQAHHPKLMQKELLAWDASLKQRHINPGSSADLTVACLLAANLQRLS